MKHLLLALMFSHLAVGGETLAETVLPGREALSREQLMSRGHQIDDSFYSACLRKLKEPDFNDDSLRQNVWTTCLRAAAIKVRIDIAERLFEVEPKFCSSWKTKWHRANALLVEGQLDQAYAYYEQLKAEFYRPNLCCYRLSEIELIRGRDAEALRLLILARQYEGEFSIDTEGPIPSGADLFESPTR